MARWVERRGYTLRVRTGGADVSDPVGRYVRVSLVERAGLVRSLFNVREARAEPHGDTHVVRTSGGRALSWRWLPRQDAERLLDTRMRTLEAIGYTVLDAVICSPGRWEWLYELVRRGLNPSPPQTRSLTATSPSLSLRETLVRLTGSPDHVIERAAAAVHLDPHLLAEPRAPVVRRVSPECLAELLPFLAHHRSPIIRAIGARWFALPALPYHLPQSVLRTWLETDPELGDLLAPRLSDEALALLGPELVHRLARTGRASVRGPLQRWATRLGG